MLSIVFRPKNSVFLFNLQYLHFFIAISYIMYSMSSAPKLSNFVNILLRTFFMRSAAILYYYGVIVSYHSQ